MRSYLIEDLTGENLKRIEARLIELGLRGPLDGIYFLPLPEDLLSPDRKSVV